MGVGAMDLRTQAQGRSRNRFKRASRVWHAKNPENSRFSEICCDIEFNQAPPLLNHLGSKPRRLISLFLCDLATRVD
jgi:hypothetical protein